MKKNLKLIKNSIKIFSTNKQKKDLDFDYFEYKGEKFSDKSNWGGLSREEVLGTSQVGYDSFRYAKENLKLKFNLLIIGAVSFSYIYYYWYITQNVNEACDIYLANKNKANKVYSVVE